MATMVTRPQYGQYVEYPTPGIGTGPHDGIGAIDFMALWQALWRRKVLIFTTVFALTALTYLVLLLITPTYSATAIVMVDPGQTKIVDAIQAVMQGETADVTTVASEVSELESRGLAQRVISKLHLDQDPEFNTSLQPPGLLDPILVPMRQAINAAKLWIKTTLSGSPPPASDVDPADALRASIIDNVASQLSVNTDGRSRVITVTFTSRDADTAANVANNLIDIYMLNQVERKFDAAKTDTKYLSDRIAELRKQVEVSEAAVEKYRSEQGLIQNGDVMVSAQEASDVGAQLAIVRSQRAEAESRLNEVQNALNKPDGTASVSAVLDSGLIQALREQEAEVQRKVSDLSQKLGPKHPDLLSAKAELAQIRAKIDIEAAKVIEGLKNAVVAARAREASLSESLDRVKGEAGQQNQSEVKLKALEREATASRTLLETFLQRQQETTNQQGYQQADAHLVSKADVPQSTSFPNKKLLLPAGFVAASAIGILLAFLLEFMDRSFRSEEQVEQVLGVGSFGLVPSLKRAWGKSKRPSTYVVQHPASAYVESIRNLYTGLRLSNGDHLPRTIMIASSLPREGKTTVVASLASLLAAAGLKTIVVDTDLRKPSIHQALALAAEPGLVDHLRKRLPLESVIQHDRATGIDAITAGSPTTNPPDLLGTNQMKELLARLQATYDAVILDSAPVLAVSDARILVRMVDKIVFLVRWADTRRDTALRGLQQISEVGDSNLAGFMLTMVDFEKYAKYQYGTFGNYYRRIEGYYTA
jgi:polysaccharide biosynthesis transport protein